MLDANYSRVPTVGITQKNMKTSAISRHLNVLVTIIIYISGSSLAESGMFVWCLSKKSASPETPWVEGWPNLIQPAELDNEMLNSLYEMCDFSRQSPTHAEVTPVHALNQACKLEVLSFELHHSWWWISAYNTSRNVQSWVCVFGSVTCHGAVDLSVL